MPRLRSNQVPSYCRHKQSGQAIVTLSGRDILLGKYDSPESRKEYNRLIAEWIVNGRQLPGTHQGELLVIELAERFIDFAETYYRRPNGKPTTEVESIKRIVRLLDLTHGSIAAASFGPLSLEAVRAEMIKLGWVRKSINRQVDRIKRMFKWGVSRELIPSSVYEGLRTLNALKLGRSTACESEPVSTVPDAMIEQTLPFLSRHIAAMVRLQLLTGMRPGEVCVMRWCDIDQSGKVWIYTPPSHKTQYLGHARKIAIGPKGQELLKDFLRMDQTAHIFSPSDAVAELRQKRSDARKTPLSCGNRVGTNRRRDPQVQPGSGYAVTAYGRAIRRACALAFPLPDHFQKKGKAKLNEQQTSAVRQWKSQHAWHPHQLRHNTATRIARQYGVADAQLVLGHQHLNTTEIYLERDVSRATKIAEFCG